MCPQERPSGGVPGAGPLGGPALPEHELACGWTLCPMCPPPEEEGSTDVHRLVGGGVGGGCCFRRTPRIRRGGEASPFIMITLAEVRLLHHKVQAVLLHTQAVGAVRPPRAGPQRRGAGGGRRGPRCTLSWPSRSRAASRTRPARSAGPHRGLDVLATQLLQAAELEAQRQLSHVHDEQQALHVTCAPPEPPWSPGRAGNGGPGAAGRPRLPSPGAQPPGPGPPVAALTFPAGTGSCRCTGTA